MKINLKPGLGMGRYDVLRNGARIGHVTKFEDRYNIRRLIVVRGWNAYDATGHAAGSANTRKAAVALVAAAADKAAAVTP